MTKVRGFYVDNLKADLEDTHGCETILITKEVIF
jgi:hypothetical protein